MSSVSLAVVAKLRDELRFVIEQTLALAAAAPFVRRPNQGNRTMARHDPSPQQAAQAAVMHERLQRWHGITKSLLRRYAIKPVVDVKYEVGKAAAYVLLQRTTIPDVPEGRWRAQFVRELTSIRLKLEEVLDLCERLIPPSSPQAVYDPTDLYIDARRVTGITANEVNAVIDACAAGKANLAMLESIGKKLFPLLVDSARGWIRLHLANAGFLANAPWESLHDGKNFLAVQPSIAVSRVLERASAAPAAHEMPLRLLVTVSSPSDQDALNVDHEAQLLRDALGGLELIGRAEVHIATDGSLDTMLRMLRVAEDAGRPYNAWHFIGHGRFRDASGQSELAMTGNDGRAQYIDAAQLRVLFQGHPLRMAVFNACESGTFAPIDCGAAIVVAMQFRISDEAAIVLADEVYGAFAAGADILSAMTHARRALFFRSPGVEWVTPILMIDS
jgi:CHAT domain-containing protein